MITTKLDHRVNSLKWGDLEDLEVGDRIEICGINQSLPEEEYNLSNWQFIKQYEKKTYSKFRVTVPTAKFGRRYVLIEKISGLF